MFSQGDICILIGGLNMEKLLPKAGSLIGKSGGGGWILDRSKDMCERRQDHILLRVLCGTSPSISLVFFCPQTSGYMAPYTPLCGWKDAFSRQVENKTAIFPRERKLNTSHHESSTGPPIKGWVKLFFPLRAHSESLLWNLGRRSLMWLLSRSSGQNERCFLLFLNLGAHKGGGGNMAVTLLWCGRS